MTWLEDARAITDAATPGEWSESVLGSEGYAVMAPPPTGQVRRRCVSRHGMEAWEVDKANAEYVATFDPPTVAAMLDALEAAAKLVDRESHEFNEPALQAAFDVSDALAVVREQWEANRA